MMAVGVGPARITQQIYIGSIGIEVDAMLKPPPLQVVGHEISCFRTVAYGNIAPIGLQVINAMRNHLTFLEVVVIVVIDLYRELAIAFAISVKVAQTFFLFAVYANQRAFNTNNQ